MIPVPGDQQHTRDYFDQHADFWQDVYESADSYAAYSLLKRHVFALKTLQAGVSAGGAVLDVGCGAGITARALAEQGFHVYGVDYSLGMIRRAQAGTHDNARCQFCVAGAEHLPFENESLDAVIGLGLLGNIQELDKALVEMRRVLKTGGLLLVTMPNGMALDRLLGLPRSLPLFVSWPIRTRLRRLSNAWRKAFGFAPKPDSSLRYGRSMVPGLLRRRLRGHGFTTIKASAIAFGPMRPFGAPVVSDARAIRISMTLCRWERHCKWLRPFASTIIYTARKR